MSGQPLNPMQKLADIMVDCARREDAKGLKSAQELLGRIQTGEIPFNRLSNEVSGLNYRTN